MLLHIKLSKDNEREVHLCYEDKKWIQKVYNRGVLIKKDILKDEKTAFEVFKNEDIGETY